MEIAASSNRAEFSCLCFNSFVPSPSRYVVVRAADLVTRVPADRRCASMRRGRYITLRYVDACIANESLAPPRTRIKPRPAANLAVPKTVAPFIVEMGLLSQASNRGVGKHRNQLKTVHTSSRICARSAANCWEHSGKLQNSLDSSEMVACAMLLAGDRVSP